MLRSAVDMFTPNHLSDISLDKHTRPKTTGEVKMNLKIVIGQPTEDEGRLVHDI